MYKHPQVRKSGFTQNVICLKLKLLQGLQVTNT